MRTDDERIEIVAACLGTDRRFGFGHSYLAKTIVAALDEYVLGLKWSQQREEVLNNAIGCWVPRAALLVFLNTLPGAVLTPTDLEVRIKDKMRLYGNSYPFDGEPHHQADCLRVYERERDAGTGFIAILTTIGDEVVGPASNRDYEEHRMAGIERRVARARSGKDFGMTNGLGVGDYYMRDHGQLYRVHRVEKHQWNVFLVSDVGDAGTSAMSGLIFRTPYEARDAIRSQPRAPR